MDLTTLTPQERQALGCFKALELSNAFSWALLQDSIFSSTVRKVMREREIILGGKSISLKSPGTAKVINYGSRVFFLGRLNLSSEEWKESKRFSRLLCNSLRHEVLLGLHLVFHSYSDYPVTILGDILEYLMPGTSGEEKINTLKTYKILNRSE